MTLMPAAQLAGEGFVALAFSYCGAPGTSEKLCNVEIRRTVEAIEWLASQPEVVDGKVAVLGWSRGAEHALLVCRRVCEER